MKQDEIKNIYTKMMFRIWRHGFGDDRILLDVMEDFRQKKLGQINLDEKTYQKLLREFITRHNGIENRVSWYYVSRNVRLSKSLILEFSDKLWLQYIPLCCIRMQHEVCWKTFL